MRIVIEYFEDGRCPSLIFESADDMAALDYVIVPQCSSGGGGGCCVDKNRIVKEFRHVTKEPPDKHDEERCAAGLHIWWLTDKGRVCVYCRKTEGKNDLFYRVTCERGLDPR